MAQKRMNETNQRNKKKMHSHTHSNIIGFKIKHAREKKKKKHINDNKHARQSKGESDKERVIGRKKLDVCLDKWLFCREVLLFYSFLSVIYIHFFIYESDECIFAQCFHILTERTTLPFKTLPEFFSIQLLNINVWWDFTFFPLLLVDCSNICKIDTNNVVWTHHCQWFSWRFQS